MIKLSLLAKTYGEEWAQTVALDNISFAIKKGEFVSIVGPSGSGKSTLLHILSFLDRPTSGAYFFEGKNTSEYSDRDFAYFRNKKMGFVFQSFNLLGRASVYENVELPLLYSGVISKKRKSLIEEAVRSVGLGEKMFQEAGTLSGGQKQRVAIARALVNDPEVIFADEPTGNLDSQSGGQVMEILIKLNREGKTIVLVTHETYTAECAERIITLRDGRIESDKPVLAHQVNTFIK